MRTITSVAALLLAASWAVAPPAAAGPGTAPSSPGAPPLAHVSVLPTARVADDGAAVTVRLRTRCVPDGTDGIQWEGFVDVSQGDVFGWTELSLTCDGRRHVETVVVPVSAGPGTASFSRGTATVWAVLIDENTLTQHAQDSRTVRVR